MTSDLSIGVLVGAVTALCLLLVSLISFLGNYNLNLNVEYLLPRRDGTVDCKLQWYPKFYDYIILLVDLKPLVLLSVIN